MQSATQNDTFAKIATAIINIDHANLNIFLSECPTEVFAMRDKYGLTLLHLIIQFQDKFRDPIAIAAQVLEKCPAEVFAMTDNYGNNPLHLAIKFLRTVKDKQIAEKILEKCPTAVFATQTHTKDTPLHLALKFNPAIAAQVLEKCPQEVLSIKDSDKNTPLHLAIKSSNLEIVNGILEKCPTAVFATQTHTKDTPLHLALKFNPTIAAQVLEKCPQEVLSLKDSDKNTPLHLAIKSSNLEIVNSILERCPDEVFASQNSYGENPLHLALLHNNFPMVKSILENCPAKLLEMKIFSEDSLVDYSSKLRNKDLNDAIDAAKKRFYHQEKFFTLPDQPSDQAKINAVIEFLKDYSGSGKNLLRLHWNRHHTKRAKELITTLQALKNDANLDLGLARQQVEACLNTAQALQGFNEKGSFNRRMKLCLRKLGN